jgi:hypothetical protein
VLTFDAVTTFAEHHWDSHARRCVESFREYWPGFTLRQFSDEQLAEWSDWLSEFKQRHGHRDTSNYRFDAVRFAHKVAALELAFEIGKADVLVWMDADCVTHAPVDGDWLTGLLGGADFAYLTRAGKYPETGFMLIRRNQAGSEFIAELVNLYRTDALFVMQEWHDAWAIGELVRLTGIRAVSLSGAAENTAHPLVNGPLGERLDHLKGKRKQLGKSRPADLKTKRTEAYWNG